MPVKVLKRAYKNQFYPASAETDWLLGNVGDWQRIEVTFEAKVEFEASQTETVTVDSKNDLFKLNNGRNWQEYGFDIGDTVTFSYVYAEDQDGDGEYNEIGVQKTFTVQNIYKETMESSTDIDLGNISVIPTDRGNIVIRDVKFESEKEIQGIKFRYSLITNANFNTGNLASFIDGSVSEFSFAGLNNLNVNQVAEMNPDGLQSGMAIQNMFISKVPVAGVEPGAWFGTSGNVRVTSGFTLGSPDPFFEYGSRSIPLSVIAPSDDSSAQTNDQIPFVDCGSFVCGYSSLPNGSQVFIDKALTSETRSFLFTTVFFVRGARATTSNNSLRIVIHKFTGGANYDYDSTIVLKDYGGVGNLISTYQNLVQPFSLNISSGDSYSFCVEYRNSGISTGVVTYVDYSILSASIAELVEVSNNFNYKVSANFMIPSFFESPSNLENRTPPSILFNAGSLTDNFELEMYPEWNNPNTVIKNVLSETERLGNTGWFNENFNGLDNNFTIESVKYLDNAGNIINQLDYAQPITVEVEIGGINNLSTNSEFNIGFSWIPQDDEDYKEKTTPFHKNLLVNTGKEIVGQVSNQLSFNLSENTNGNVYKGYSFDDRRMDLKSATTEMFAPSGVGKAIVKATFDPTSDFTKFFDEKDETDRNYIIWVSVADHNLAINFSDRVSLLADYNSMVKAVPPVGPWPGMVNKFIEHPQDANVSGVIKYYGFVEDDILSRVEFTVNKNDNIFLENMVFGFEVLNKITGTRYTLQEISVNLSEFPKDRNGIQQITIDDTRGFKLEPGNNKNWVKIERNESKDTEGVVAYIAYFAAKIRWEDWIAREDALDEYFDTSLENNGKSNDWISYLRAGNPDEHEVNFRVYTDVTEDGEFKRFDNYYQLTFNDYDENLNITTTHEYYRDSTNDLLNIGTDPETGKPLGVLLDNEPTRIEITYTNLTEDFDILKMYSRINIEIDKGAGQSEFRQLSSVWGSESDNPLIPLAGETKLKFESLAPNVVRASCLVDPTKLERVLRYKISGRIGCWPEGVSSVPDGLYEPLYEIIYE
jgi:hypothetical protein